MIQTGMVQVRPFEPDDLLMIQAREPDSSIAAGIPDLVESARLYEKYGPAFTGLIDGVPLAAAGLVIIWPGVATGWAFTSAMVPKYRLSFHRTIKQYLDMLVRERNLHRVQVEIPVSHTVSREWVKRLGFHEEGIMRQFGADKSDYVRSVRLY